MIVTFAWPSSHHRTGGVVVMYQFANGLARLGHEVHFLHGPAWPGRIADLSELHWFDFDERVEHHVVDAIDDPRLPVGDVIFADGARPEQGLPAAMIQGARMLAEDIERATFHRRGPKVCVARWLVDVGRRYGVPDEQLWHVTLGMDHSLFAPRRPIEGHRRFDIAIVHNDHPTKGWKVGWDAVGRIRASRPQLTVAVFGGERPQEPLDDGAEFFDYPTHEVLVDEVYSESRIFLQPSYREGFGYPCIEAMACGAALVTTDNGGSAEYAVHEETALVVPVGDAQGLADAALALLDDDPRRQRLARTGERYVRRFDWDVGSKQLEQRLLEYVAEPDRFRSPSSPELATTVLWDDSAGPASRRVRP